MTPINLLVVVAAISVLTLVSKFFYERGRRDGRNEEHERWKPTLKLLHKHRVESGTNNDH